MSAIHVEKTVTINRSPDEVYRFWHDFENLPHFMTHLESVQSTADGRSHWVAKAPAGRSVEWDAEITEDEPNSLIAWHSTGQTIVPNRGAVRFQAAPPGRGTVVHVTLEYDPPGGVLSATLAKLFGEEPAQQVSDDLRRFKQVMEAGEVPTTDGQPSGRDGSGGTSSDDAGDNTSAGQGAGGMGALSTTQPDEYGDQVDIASEESFPASDPPAWTAATERDPTP